MMHEPQVLLVVAIPVALVAFARFSGSSDQRPATLPAPKLNGAVSLEDAIARRRSVRSFAKRALLAGELGQLAWAAQGITDPRNGFRAVPSAGALYPLEVYFVTPEAAYHYVPDGHRFETHRRGDLRAALAEAALGQPCVREAAVNVVITAVFARTTGKYGPRGRMYVHMEAGHVGQNVLLQAVALGLGGVPVGAFRDEQVATTLALPADHAPLYILAIGRPRD